VAISWRFALTTTLIVVLAAVLGWTTIVGAAFDPAGLHDVGSLPDRLHVCGRTWNKGSSVPSSLETIGAHMDGVPILLAPGLLGGFLSACPSGACSTDAASAPCDTVVFVRVGEDSYVSYALSGGP